MICCGEEMRQTNLGYYVCEICNNQVKDELGIIKETLKKHPGANAITLARLTGISSKIIVKYLNNGTLTSIKKNKDKNKDIRGYYAGDQDPAKWHSDIPKPNKKKKRKK